MCDMGPSHRGWKRCLGDSSKDTNQNTQEVEEKMNAFQYRLDKTTKPSTLFCLVDIKKRSFLTFCFIFLNASSHLCFRFFSFQSYKFTGCPKRVKTCYKFSTEIIK